MEAFRSGLETAISAADRVVLARAEPMPISAEPASAMTDFT